VLGTLHTTSAVKTIDRMVDALPAEEREQTKGFLSQGLIGVVTQVLVRTPDLRGRRAVCEVMVMNRAIGKLITTEQTHMIPSQLQTGKESGMQTLDQALLAVVQGREVDPEDAFSYAVDKRPFARYVPEGTAILRADVTQGL
jgi:twitching motility protein PilT